MSTIIEPSSRPWIAGPSAAIRSAPERVEAEGDPAEAIRVLTQWITAILQEN